MKHFCRENLKPGYIGHSRTRHGFVGRWIRKVCSGPDLDVWGNHDFLVLEDCDLGLAGGETSPWRSRVVPLEWYEKRMNRGEIEVSFLIPARFTESKGLQASAWWRMRVNGRLYDFMAYPRLFVKNTIVDLSESRIPWLKAIGDRSCGWVWARWCTESVADAWSEGAKDDHYHNPNPTPGTTERRVEDGELVTAVGAIAYSPSSG